MGKPFKLELTCKNNSNYIDVFPVDFNYFFNLLLNRHSIGDTKVPFCLQSCVKPLKYAIAVNDLGTEYVHRYVGKEPSGLRFNKLFLNEDGKNYVKVRKRITSFPNLNLRSRFFFFLKKIKSINIFFISHGISVEPI